MTEDHGTQLLDTLYEALGSKYNRTREGVHVSDIIICPREQVFKHLNPQAVDNTQLGFFTSGEAIGVAIQTLAKTHPQYIAEHEVKLGGLEAHVDLYDSANNIPIECKSYNGADMEQPKPHYVAQLKAYMAMLNAPRGVILVQLLQHFRGKNKKLGPFRTWVIAMTPEQLSAERERLIHETRTYAKALELKDPSIARNVLNDEDVNWKCTYCKFVNECKAMQ